MVVRPGIRGFVRLGPDMLASRQRPSAWYNNCADAIDSRRDSPYRSLAPFGTRWRQQPSCLPEGGFPLLTERALDRFFTYAVPTNDGCWEWKGLLNRGGYGRFKIGHWQRSPAHRISWEIATGTPPPPDLLVLHACDNPPSRIAHWHAALTPYAGYTVTPSSSRRPRRGGRWWARIIGFTGSTGRAR